MAPLLLYSCVINHSDFVMAVPCSAYCGHGGSDDDSGGDGDGVPELYAGSPLVFLLLMLQLHSPHFLAQVPGFLKLETEQDGKLRSACT